MKSTAYLAFLLLSGSCISASAGGAGLMEVSEERLSSLRESVEAHRAAKRDDVRREDAAAGRRLTAGERAELREQVRQQWARQEAENAPLGATASAESQPAERIVPVPTAAPSRPVRDVVAAPRAQRP